MVIVICVVWAGPRCENRAWLVHSLHCMVVVGVLVVLSGL